MGEMVSAGALRCTTLAWLTAAAVGAMGCSKGASGPTELVVAVHSDMAVPAELSSIHLHVLVPSGETILDQPVNLSAPGAPTLPLTFSLEAADGALSPVVVTVTGMTSGGTVERMVETGFVRGESRLAYIWLLRECVGVSCPDGQTCGAGGLCAEAAVPPEHLPPWTGELDPVAPDDAGVAIDAAPDAATEVDAHVGDDATMADGGACSFDTDCPEDELGDCTDHCVNASNPCSLSGQTCTREVTTYTCDDGTCMPSSASPRTEACERDTEGDFCDDGDLCTPFAQCTSEVCEGDSWCQEPCVCDPSTGDCTGGEYCFNVE